MTKTIRYYIARCRNAFWMMRTGRFKLFVESLYMEFYPAVARFRAQLHIVEPPIVDSAFVDKRKLVRPSIRPTCSQRPLELPMQANATLVAEELSQILATLTVQENSNS